MVFAQARAADDLASRWTPAMEKLARRAMKKATRLAWQYEAIADAARRLNDRFSILSGALGALVGTGSLVGAATPVSTIGIGSASWPTAVSVVIGYAISLIAVLVTNWRLGEVASKGVTAKVALLNTAREIRWQLAQPAADRADAYEFVYAREAEIAHILAAAPPREEWVRENYRRSVAGGTAADEDLLDETPPPTPPTGHTAIELPRLSGSSTPVRTSVDMAQRAAELFPRAAELLPRAAGLVMQALERSRDRSHDGSRDESCDKSCDKSCHKSCDESCDKSYDKSGSPELGAPESIAPESSGLAKSSPATGSPATGSPATGGPMLTNRPTGIPNLLRTDPLRALAMLKGAFDTAHVNHA
jgi:hypothetical protein